MAEQVMDSNGELKEAAKMMASTEKKCPGCGAALDFSAAVGKLKCPYCETEVDIPEVKQEAPKQKVGVGQKQKDGAAQENALDFKKLAAAGNRDWGTATKIASCKYCGAEMVMDVNSISTTCEFCGSNHVTEAADDGNMLSPGGVVPFKVTQNEASERFKKWIGAKLFAPNAAKKSAEADSFKGVYLPYWTFDASTESFYTGRYGKDRRVKDKDGNTRVVTDWYNTMGEYKEFIDDQIICASKNHTESFLKSIEPFDTSENKVYSPEYLSGFKAERYTVSIEEGWKGATKDIERHLKSVIASKIKKDNNADRSEVGTHEIVYSNLTYKYLLLPVWFSSFTYNGTVYQFVVNGQTGKVGGKSPVSGVKVGIAIAIAVIAVILFFLIFGGD